MTPFHRRLQARRAQVSSAVRPPRVWDPGAGIHYCEKLPRAHLEPICERVSRVQGEKFDRLVASIGKHGLANPLITVSELPEQNLADWREWRLRFLYVNYPAPIKVVVGHNRYAACVALGWAHVPVLHCGPIPKAAQGEDWLKLDSLEEAQLFIRDGALGVGPYSLVMDQYTTPLRAMPAGFEP